MKTRPFADVAAEPDNPRWEVLTSREFGLYQRPSDMRSRFGRDYTRILHCSAYRRLKRKTQVFFATGNDHVCTRIEHVTHVASISRTIASQLGLNSELTEAIATGHDLGHPAFGHAGETILSRLERARPAERFWREKNSLWFVDKLETLADESGWQKNLDLTYAVRDGIVCHCGEVDEKPITPRDSVLDLHSISKPGEVEAFTWEGCVVKIADKIAYMGRDLEDAVALKILTSGQLGEIGGIVGQVTGEDRWTEGFTNARLIHRLIIDLCEHSNPSEGLRFSVSYSEVMRQVRAFSRAHIYDHPRMRYFKAYAEVVLGSLFDKLSTVYAGEETLAQVRTWGSQSPLLTDTFSDWLVKYTDAAPDERNAQRYANSIVYSVHDLADYQKAVIDYLAGMTDQFAINAFEELIRF